MPDYIILVTVLLMRESQFRIIDWKCLYEILSNFAISTWS